MKRYLPYIIVLVIGFIFGTLITCNSDKEFTNTTSDTSVTKSSDTIIKWQVKEIHDTIHIVNPNVTYIKQEEVYSTPKEEFDDDKYKYEFTYDKIIYSDDKRIRTDLSITGWGGINDIDYNFKIIDSLQHQFVTNTVETKIEKTIEKTILKTNNKLYLSGEYIITPQTKSSNLRANLDYTIKDKMIIGTSVGYDKMPNVGVKIGFSL